MAAQHPSRSPAVQLSERQKSSLQIPNLTKQRQRPITRPFKLTPVARYRECHFGLVERDLLSAEEAEKVWVGDGVEHNLNISLRESVMGWGGGRGAVAGSQ